MNNEVNTFNLEAFVKDYIRDFLYINYKYYNNGTKWTINKKRFKYSYSNLIEALSKIDNKYYLTEEEYYKIFYEIYTKKIDVEK